MAVGVNKFREALAESFVNDSDVFVAIGRGNPEWDAQKTFNGAFAASPTNTLDVGDTNITSVVVKSNDEATVYVEGQDYNVDLSTGIVTRIGAGSIADEATVKVFYWISKVPLLTQEDMVDEIGRKRASVVSYATPDEEGTIVTDGGLFTQTGTPTGYVLIQVSFASGEAAGETIREFGLFVDSVLDGGLPGGQVFFEPEDVTDIGRACVFKNVNPIDKDTVGEVNETFILVM